MTHNFSVIKDLISLYWVKCWNTKSSSIFQNLTRQVLPLSVPNKQQKPLWCRTHCLFPVSKTLVLWVSFERAIYLGWLFFLNRRTSNNSQEWTQDIFNTYNKYGHRFRGPGTRIVIFTLAGLPISSGDEAHVTLAAEASGKI